MRYYQKPYDVVGYTYHAAAFCRPCGESLPEVDPEGNAKGPVFADMASGAHWFCDECGSESEEWD